MMQSSPPGSARGKRGHTATAEALAYTRGKWGTLGRLLLHQLELSHDEALAGSLLDKC